MHIRLRFHNAHNEVCILQRSMQLIKKKVKLEFKQLDGSVKEKDKIGNMTSLSYKCADLDRYIPAILGVSPAILENVIFCHQEESNWPMSEGAVLKKKFDDIFESSRYTKALEAFAKSKKDFQSQGKDHKAELMQVGAYLETARGLQEEMEAAETQLEAIRKEVESLEDQVSAVDERLLSEREALDKIKARYSEVNELQREADEEQRRINDRKESMNRVYEESDLELKRQLENFAEVMSSKESEFDSVVRNIDGVTQDVASAREKLNELTLKKGTAESLSDQCDTHC